MRRKDVIPIVWRCYSTEENLKKKKSSLLAADEMEWKDMTKGQKLVQSGKMFGYSWVIVVGVGLISVASYFVTDEILNTRRDNKIYEKTLQYCKASDELIYLIGEPIKGPTELEGWNSRGNRRSIKSYPIEDSECRFQRFSVQGSSRTARITSETYKCSESEDGLEFMVLYADVAGKKRLFLVDNRVRGPPKKRGWGLGLIKPKRGGISAAV